MAYNRPYDEDNNVLGGLFKAGSLVGGGVVAWNAIKKPDETRRKWESAKNIIAPYKAPMYNAAQQRIIAANEAIFNSRTEMNLRNKVLNQQKMQHTIQALGRPENWDTVNPIVSEYEKKRGAKYAFTNLDDIRDINNKPIGSKIHNEIKKKFIGENVSFNRFEGTTGVWSIGKEEVKIDFSKRIAGSDGWMSAKGEAFYVSPWRAHLQKVGEDKLGYKVFDPNSYILDALVSENKGSGRFLMELNEGKQFRDAYEGFRRQGIPHNEIVTLIKNKIRSEVTKFSLTEANTARNFEKVMKRLTKSDTFVVENDAMKYSTLSDEVLVDAYSRYELSHMFPGAGSNRMGKNPIMDKTSDGGVIKKIFNIFTNAKKDPSLISVVGKGEEAKRLARRMSMYGGYTGGQEATAELSWATRVSTFPQITEGVKSVKGARFLDKSLATTSIYGIDMDKKTLKRMRHNLFINDYAEDVINRTNGFTRAKNIIQRERGMVNMTLSINPFNSETIQIGDKMKGKMLTGIPRQHTVTSVAIDAADGQEAYNRSKVKLYDRNNKLIQGINGDYTIKEIMENDKLSSTVKYGGYIDVAKETILGKKLVGADMNNASSINDLIDIEENVIKSKVAMRINSDDYKQMIAATNRMGDGSMKWIGMAMDDPAKVALWGARTRGAYSTGESMYTNQLFSAAGVRSSEGNISLDFYKKTLPSIRDGKLVLGKDSPELLHFMQSAIGWQALQTDHDIKFGKNEAERFSRYINFFDKKMLENDGSFNLSKAMRSGKISFKQLTMDNKMFADQYLDTLQVLGDIRRGYARGEVTTRIRALNSDNAKKAAMVLDRQIRSLEEVGKLANGSKSIDLLQKQTTIKQIIDGVLDSSKVNNIRATGLETSRALTMGIFGGIMAQEQNWLSTGGTFNNMRISFRDMSHFLDKPEILRDLSVHSLNDTGKLVTELELMRASAAGENITGMLSAYEKNFGKINTISTDADMLKMLGGDISLDNASLKNPEVALKSFLNKKNNQNGFLREIGDRKLYVPSGDMWRGFMTPDGKGTFDQFFMQTHEMLRETLNGGMVSPDKLDDFKRGIIKEMHSTKSGLFGQIGLDIDHSIYGVHVTEDSFLHNNTIRGALETRAASGDKIASTIDNMYGQMGRISSVDFEETLRQTLTDELTISKADPNKRNVAELLTSKFGEDHFLKKYEGRLKTLDSKAKIDKLVKDITSEQISLSRAVRNEITKFATEGTPESLAKIESISERMLRTFNVRYPAIYAGSYTGTITMVDGMKEAKRSSFGYKIQKMMAADFDGDKINIKWLMSSLARQKTDKMIKYNQKETYDLLSMNMKKKVGNILFGSDDMKTALSASVDNIDAITKSILTDAPMSTAVSSYFTKALTGSYNVSAMSTKGYIRHLMEEQNMSEMEIEKISSFFENVTSKITEQEVISSKHAETLIKKAGGTGSSRIQSILNMIGNGGEKYIKDSISEIGGVHPVVQMFAMQGMGYNNDKETRKLANAVADFVDMETGWKALDEGQFRTMYDTLELGDNAQRESSWRRYSELLSENRDRIITESAEFKRSSLKDKKLLEVFAMSLSPQGKRHGGQVSENLDMIMNKAITDPQAALEAIRNNSLINNAIRVTGLREVSPGMPQARRKIIGQEAIQRGISWMVDPAVGGGPVRMGGVAALGLVAMTALNVITGDGTVEDPNDLPSVNNPSFSAPRGSGMMQGNTLTPHVGFNTNVNLLTDNRQSTEGILNYIGGLVGYNSNTVAVRQDGEDPYKQDLMFYK